MRRFGKTGRHLAFMVAALALAGCSSQAMVDKAEPFHTAATDEASAPAAGTTARAMRIPEPDTPQPLRVTDASLLDKNPVDSHEPVDLLHPQADDLTALSGNGDITASIDRPAAGDKAGKTSKRPARELASAAPSDFARLHTPMSDCEREQHQQRHADAADEHVASYCAVAMDRDVRGLY